MKMRTEMMSYLNMDANDRKTLRQIFDLVPACDEKKAIDNDLFTQIDIPLCPRRLDWLRGLVQNPVWRREPPHLGEFRKRLFETLARPIEQVSPPATTMDDADISF